jgi:SAM-dependent methyltransferase
VGEFFLLCGIAVSAYAFAILARGLREEERVVVGQLLAAPSRNLMRSIHRVLGRIGFSSAEWQLALAEMIADSPRRRSAGFDCTFDREEDPYGFLLPYGHARHSHICKILDSVRGARKFPRALEVGCAEGSFSRYLAHRCDSILATDISVIALRRAREQCKSLAEIEFALWNVRRDPMILKFDLIVAMDVLCYLARPWDLRKAARLLVDGLLPGGYLLVENDKEHYPYEGRWWADYLLHSARAIDSLFVSDPSLEVVLTEENERYVCTVLRKI